VISGIVAVSKGKVGPYLLGCCKISSEIFVQKYTIWGWKSNFWASVNYSVGNLQLSVGFCLLGNCKFLLACFITCNTTGIKIWSSQGSVATDLRSGGKFYYRWFFRWNAKLKNLKMVHTVKNDHKSSAWVLPTKDACTNHTIQLRQDAVQKHKTRWHYLKHSFPQQYYIIFD